MEPKNELISLYDYLGRAAGGELGKKKKLVIKGFAYTLLIPGKN